MKKVAPCYHVYPSMSKKRKPTHGLSLLKDKIEAGDFRVTLVAADGARQLCLDEKDICDCVTGLEGGDFIKTMEADKRPGLWHDVYKVHYHGFPLYIKLQLLGDVAWVISFKRDESV